MKIIRLLSVALVLVSVNVTAETTVQLGSGNGSSTSKGPWNQAQSNNRSRKVILFTEAELAAQGVVSGVIINAMKWYKTTNDSFINGSSATAQLYIRSASYPTGYGSADYNVLNYTQGFTLAGTQIYNAGADNIGVADWEGFTDIYYAYAGGDLEVYVNWQTTTGTDATTTTGAFGWEYSSTGADNRYMWYHGVPFTSSNFNIGNDRPNTLIVFTTPDCTTAPVAGVAVSDAPGVLCQGNTFGLTLTGNSVSNSQTYTWEKAPTDQGPWTTYSVPLQDPLIGIDAPAANTWYRAKVACGSLVSYSTAVQVLVNLGLGGNTYTIDNNQPTGGTNFISFADAMIALGCGITGPVIFNVAPNSGPYNEQIVVPQIGGASVVNTVTFNGNGATISHTSSGPGERAVIKLDGADYITINDLNIEVTGATGFEYGYGVHIIHNADFNTIKNCNIHVNTTVATYNSNAYAGIIINGHAEDPIGINYSDCDVNAITDNTITGGYYGIVLLGNSESSTITGNMITGNIIKDPYVYGIYAGYNSIAMIEGNDISRPERVGAGDFTGIMLSGYNASLLVMGNKIHDAFNAEQDATASAAAISVQGCDPGEGSEVIVANNVVYRFRTEGSQYGIKASASGYVKFQHNTIAMDFANATCDGCGVYGFYQDSTTARKLDLSNNIISLNGSGESVIEAVHFTNGVDSTTFVNNDYYIAPAVSGNADIGSINDQTYSNLLLWKIGVLGDLLSVSKDPKYQDPTSGNMRPTNASLDNAGLQMGILVDINGTLRNLTTPDVGAYEFDENTLSTGNVNVISKELGIYPNPATDIINVNFPAKVNVTVCSIDGRVLVQQDATNSIYIGHLNGGMYILKVTSNDGVILATEKILKLDK
jgi:hypothetical protein